MIDNNIIRFYKMFAFLVGVSILLVAKNDQGKHPSKQSSTVQIAAQTTGFAQNTLIFGINKHSNNYYS